MIWSDIAGGLVFVAALVAVLSLLWWALASRRRRGNRVSRALSGAASTLNRYYLSGQTEIHVEAGAGDGHVPGEPDDDAGPATPGEPGKDPR